MEEKKEMRDRLVQLCVKAYMFGGEQVIIDLPSLIGFVDQEVDKAREEGRREVIHKLKEEIDMAEVSKFIDAHQDFFNSFGKSMLLKISKLNKKK